MLVNTVRTTRMAVGITMLAVAILIGSFNSLCSAADFEFRDQERIAIVGGSLAERMNLFGHLETDWHSAFHDQKLVVRNFGWPTDEVGIQQRPDNYTLIDDPLAVFSPTMFVCFFGFNEHFAGLADDDLDAFAEKYKSWIADQVHRFGSGQRKVRFVLISPIAFEDSDQDNTPDAIARNIVLQTYTRIIESVAKDLGLPFVDIFDETERRFTEEPGLQFTINGAHLNEAGDALVASLINSRLLANIDQQRGHPSYEKLRTAVNDKSWFHLQDYRMLNGWYVYGGRRTWDKQTFPTEYRKIRNMVAVRDQYIWDLAAGKNMASTPDDTKTGKIFTPDTMFGTRDENFRRMREPETLQYPTPEESIKQMEVLDGFEVQLFASEREFPELANPTQLAFDAKGRLWVSCMVNYPQWLPGTAKPGDKLLIFEDTNGDGKADVCKNFYDQLICPTGFEFFKDGVLVVDEPRILFLRDTDNDDRADDITHVIDGIATDDTHHAMGAWEWSHGGRLYMLEGVSMSTTIETPWGPFRSKGPSGAYILDPLTWHIRHFKTPGYGNPWCMVFDEWGMGIIGDGTNGQQHWTSPLSGFEVKQRKTLRPNFNNENLRPAVGNEFLVSRHFPDEVQRDFVYGCVINMHGLPRFRFSDEPGTAGFAGRRIEDLVDSTDNFFRPVDPQIGPDGALWFGDWCNALIGHMQYSQRDPNRDHQHGRIYRLVHRQRPLIQPELQDGKTIAELLVQLHSHEWRTRYRARREIRARNKEEVLSAVRQWLLDHSDDRSWCEAMWIQESFRQLDEDLVDRLLSAEDFNARAAVVHSVANEVERFEKAMVVFETAIADRHPRVRLEALRGLSFIQTPKAAEIALQAVDQPMDYWLNYTLEHTLHALSHLVNESVLNNSSAAAKSYFRDYQARSIPGGRAIKPLEIALNPEATETERLNAVMELAKLPGDSVRSGKTVFQRMCSSCHQIANEGQDFGPALDELAVRYSKPEIIRHVLWPNETIAKGYETVQVLTLDGQIFNGFVLDENNESLSLGVATDDGRGRRVDLLKEDIDEFKTMKSSSMPEGLIQTIAPAEFLNLIQYLNGLVTDIEGWRSARFASDKTANKKTDRWIDLTREAKLRINADFPVAGIRMSISYYARLVQIPENLHFTLQSPPSKILRSKLD